ncbi:hypothetical protein Tco_1506668 [Tanacetum coccineum]
MVSRRPVSNRDIFRAGFNWDTKLQDLICNGTWTWPDEWNVKYPVLMSINVPIISDSLDKLEWRDPLKGVKLFAVSNVWESIQFHYNVVPWYNVVLFSNYVPSQISMIISSLIVPSLRRFGAKGSCGFVQCAGKIQGYC